MLRREGGETKRFVSSAAALRWPIGQRFQEC
jgi:hypothetical protein